MNEKKKIPPIAALIPFLLIIGMVFLAIKSLFSGQKNTGKKQEMTPANAEAERHRKETEIAVFRTIPAEIPVNLAAVPIHSVPTPVFPPAVPPLPTMIPLSSAPVPAPKKIAAQIPSLRKRKRITRENMATIFRHGSRKLNLTTAVAELKGLGFGKSAAYGALSANGQFSGWLHFAPDGIITWTDR